MCSVASVFRPRIWGLGGDGPVQCARLVVCVRVPLFYMCAMRHWWHVFARRLSAKRCSYLVDQRGAAELRSVLLLWDVGGATGEGLLRPQPRR